MEKISTLTREVTKDSIKNETMVFSASPQFAYLMGDALTKSCLEAIGPLPETDTVIDTRVHMLKPGWFPSIPGWHCDAVPRDENKQVDLFHPKIDDIIHYLCVIDFETGSLTEFLDEQPDFIDFDGPREGETLWGSHSRQIKEWGLSSTQVESKGIYKFSARDYHNTTPATGHGWRFFFRASVGTFTRGPYNEVRQQVQTYLPYEDLGW